MAIGLLTKSQNKYISQYENIIDGFYDKLYMSKFQLKTCVLLTDTKSLRKFAMFDLYVAYEKLYIINLYQIFEFMPKSSKVKKAITSMKKKLPYDLSSFSIFEHFYFNYKKEGISNNLKKNLSIINLSFQKIFKAQLGDIRHLLGHINFENISSSANYEYNKGRFGSLLVIRDLLSEFDKIVLICNQIFEEYFEHFIKPMFKAGIPTHLNVKHIQKSIEKRYIKRTKEFNKQIIVL